jgi:lysozyme
MSYDRVAMRAELRVDEGEKLRAYRCTAGKLTIGIGRNLDDVGIRPAETERLGITKTTVIRDGITRAQSAALLDADLDEVERGLDRFMPWWRTLDPVRQRVIVNMAFNLGVPGLMKFRNTLAMVKRGDYAAAAVAMGQSKWAGQVGDRAERLQHMMRTGARP